VVEFPLQLRPGRPPQGRVIPEDFSAKERQRTAIDLDSTAIIWTA